MNRLILVALLLIWASAPLFAKERVFPPLAELQNSKMCKKALKDLSHLKVTKILRAGYTMKKLNKYRNSWKTICAGGQVTWEELYEQPGNALRPIQGDFEYELKANQISKEELRKAFLALNDYLPTAQISIQPGKVLKLGFQLNSDALEFIKPWLEDNSDDLRTLYRAKKHYPYPAEGNRNSKYGPIENTGCQFLGRANLDIIIPILDKPSSQKEKRKKYKVDRFNRRLKHILVDLNWCHQKVIQVCDIEPEVAKKHYKLLFDYAEKYGFKFRKKNYNDEEAFIKKLFQKAKEGTLKIIKAPSLQDTSKCTPVD